MTDTPSTPEPVFPGALSSEDFETLDNILDDLRKREEETPQWEFCEGFMAALACTRREIPPDEYMAVLLDFEGAEDEAAARQLFADDAQRAQFMDLWERRYKDICRALDADVESLQDERAFYPQVGDMRGMLARLPEEERKDIDMDSVPSFAQVWALGFMYAVESWPDEWALSRQEAKDKQAVEDLDAALGAIIELTDNDPGPMEMPMLGEDAAPSASEVRLEQFGEALWAVYDLRGFWRSFGAKVATIHKEATPGRNDLCPCGSGKKYKKCHGAG
ncbi:MAG: UPF0149 family protein [Polaromonas sp.]|uniref:UPF0149 family protein n=1 Tax=Polaromonas sp. TaxID=1869339 RepID=UPI00271635C4|nr:UPF0149 family protein [Polaromonas sp.]MDO9115949.1 UPF0149 family protein [Polaromonas sp.]MDP1885049.1 UPF0149 family protein [Polaromonas sp.]